MRGHDIRRGAALLLLLLVTAGCQSDEERIAEHLQRATAYTEAGSAKEAIIELRTALQLDPQNADINFRIAELMRAGQQNADAVFFYRETVRLAPDHKEASLALARLLAGNETEEARRIIRRVVERDPQDAVVHIVRSEVELGAGDAEAALEAAQLAVELAPDSFAAQLHLGVTYRALIRGESLGAEVPEWASREKALAALDRGIELAEAEGEASPEWLARAWAERGFLLGGWEERREEAPASFRRAVEVAAPSRRAELGALDATLAYSRGAGDRELSRWALERRVELEPERLADWRNLARLSQQHDQSGLEVLRRLIAQRPQDAAAQVLYGRFLRRWESGEAAVAHLEGVADQTDDPQRVWATVVEIHGQMGDFEAAQAGLERLQASHPGDPQTRFAEAYLAYLSNDVAGAAETLRAVSREIESLSVERLLAQVEYQLGRYEAALAALERAQSLAGEPVVALLRLQARVHLAARNWEDTLATLRRLQRARGGSLNADEATWYAGALYRTGRREAGRRLLERLLANEEPPLEAVLLLAREESDRRPEEVGRAVDAALERHPDDPRLVARRARLDLGADQPEAALARLDAALERNPDAVGLRILRARVRGAQGDLDGALADARRAFDQTQGALGTAELLVSLLSRSEGLDEAIAALESEQQAGTLATPGRLLLARLHLGRGESDRAIELLEQVLAEEPGRSLAKNDLAYLLAEQGQDLERARKLAQEARSERPESHAVADTLGFVLLRQGLARPALEQFQVAIDLVEATGENARVPPSYHYHRGLALKALERNQEAAEAFEEALAGAEDFPDASDARRELAALRDPT